MTRLAVITFRVVLLLVLCRIIETRRFRRPYASSEALARFITTIARHYELHSLSVVYNANMTKESMVGDFLSDLHANNDSYFKDLPQLVINQKMHLCLGRQMRDGGLYVAFADNMNDAVFEWLRKMAHGSRNTYTVFVVAQMYKKTEREFLLNHLWDKQFHYCLVMAERRDLFTVDPYPWPSVRNVTSLPVSQYFPPRNPTDLRGYKLTVTVRHRFPDFFLYRDPKTNVTSIDGMGGVHLRTFAEFRNISLELRVEDGTRYGDDDELLYTQLVTEKYHGDCGLDISYSYSLINVCLMVPLPKKIPLALYLLLPFSKNVWLFLVGTIVVVEVLYRMWLYMWRGHPSLKHFPKTLTLIIINLLLSIPLQHLKRLRVSKANKVTFVAAMCLGISAWSIYSLSVIYVTALDSILTVTLFEQPETSVDSLIKEGIPLLFSKLHYESLMMQPNLFAQLQHLILLTSNAELERLRLDLNTSYVYPVFSLHWPFIQRIQKFANRKRFYLSNICFGHSTNFLPMARDSHLYDSYKMLSQSMQQSMIVKYWRHEVFARASQMGYVHTLRDTDIEMDDNAFEPLSVEMLSPFFIAHFFCLFICLLVFIIEVAYYRIQQRLRL